jgi:hypothetical protein
MMSNDKEKAKGMFFEYACNTFFMNNDGVLNDYLRFGISPAQENEWRQEYISFWVNQLSVDDLTAVDKLRDAEAGESLPSLMAMAREGDGYAKLWYANAIWQLANRANISKELRIQACQVAINLWQDLVEQKFDITEDHKGKIFPYLRALDASTPEEYVINYARHRLREAVSKQQ